MNKLSAIAAVVVLMTQLSLEAAEPNHPLSKLEKGQWIAYSVTDYAEGHAWSGTGKTTVVSTDAKSVTLEFTGTANGVEQVPERLTTDLTKPFNPLADLFARTDSIKIDQEQEGKETLEIAGKKYSCDWFRYTFKADYGEKLTEETKVWFCKEKPTGIIRVEMKSDSATILRIEMTKFGNE